MNNPFVNFRKLSKEEIHNLKSQGCNSANWDLIFISPDLDLTQIVNVYFKDVVNISQGVKLTNIKGGLGGCTIRENVVIENVSSLIFEPEATHGVGTMVSVLDETGSRAIPIYPGISSQVAALMAREPKWLKGQLHHHLNEFLDSKVTPPEIGEKAIIRYCGSIKNVFIDKEIIVEGASHLKNGSLINNAEPGKCLTYVGEGVGAENFILEDGRLESNCYIKNCYVGQGVVISNAFNAHDSVFFANSTLEKGEAQSVFAGPYTVSMHKGTLLIGCQTSFMNAGSSTNQSNHMYKLGPVHWGLLERGVKTASSSYLMHGAKIGAFTMLMGSHKTHPDSSEFPFSYLFGDERGSTVVVPGVMLRSCGLLRDETKWPARDRRQNRKLPLFDHITFDVLNPYTISTMLKAIHTIEDILSKPADDDLFMRYKGMKFTRAAAERAQALYTYAVYKYLSTTLPDGVFPERDNTKPEDWVDLSGQLLPRSILKKVLETDNIPEAQTILDEAFENYKSLEMRWLSQRFGEKWRQKATYFKFFTEKFDEMVEEDRNHYLQMLAREEEMLAL